MKYLIYYSDEQLHREAEFPNHRELEKFITEGEGCSLTFKEEPEAGAVFITNGSGLDVGFYMESD